MKSYKSHEMILTTVHMIIKLFSPGKSTIGIRNSVCNTSFSSFTYKWAQKAEALHYTWQEKLARGKPSSLLDPVLSYKGNEVY
jgi:hypothetical protein